MDAERAERRERPVSNRLRYGLTGLAVFIGLLWVLVEVVPWRGKEIVVENRSLSSWLDAMAPGQSFRERRSAEKVIQRLGERAVPDLLSMSQSRDFFLKEQLTRLMRKQSFYQIRLEPAWIDHRRARDGFRVLGERAAEAVPDLVELLHSDDCGDAAVDCLVRIGRASVPDLIRMLGEGDQASRLRAARALAEIGWDAVRAIPMLVAGLKDEDPRIRSECASTLAAIGEQPDKVIPAIAPLVNDDNPMVRVAAIEALGDFREDSKGVLNSLFQGLWDADWYVRHAALVALTKVDEEVGMIGTNLLQRTSGRL